MERYLYIFLILTLALIVGCSPMAVQDNTTGNDTMQDNTSGIYSPDIDPSDFTSDITNRYFTLEPGTRFVYEGDTDEGLERIEVYVTDETRTVMGIETRVVWDRVWLDGELIEDTRDWYAQDNDGNVWYFGEETSEIENGEIVSTRGSWQAGIDGAQPGIIMKADPQVGDSYRQEYYAGEAEDMGDVVSLNETVTVPYGTFENCVKTLDYTPLEPGVEENKYYCPEIGNVALEVNIENGERIGLVDVEEDSEQSS